MKRPVSTPIDQRTVTTSQGVQEDLIGISDYQELVHASSARIACFDFSVPIARNRTTSLSDLWNASSLCIEANDAFATAAGLSRREAAIGLSLPRLLPAARGYEALFALWQKNGFSDAPFEAEVRSLHRQAEVLQAVIYAKGNTATFSRVWIIFRDVTRHAKAIDDLARNERHYRTLVERPGLVMVRIRQSGEWEYMSPGVLEMLGHRREEFSSDRGLFRSLVHPDDVHRYEIIRTARELRSLEPVETEYRVRMADGTYRTFFVRQFPKIDQHGQPEYYDVLALDIEQHKQMERRLLHAQRLDTVGSLAAGIAHDVNNHLTAVLGQLSEALRAVDEFHPAFDKVAAAQKAAMQCADMTKQLLHLGRQTIESKEELHPETVVHDSLDLVRHVIPTTIDITIRAPQKPRLIAGNATQIHQVIMNLVLNARDAMPGGGVLGIEIGSTRLKGDESALVPQPIEPGDYTTIQIGDTGSGMPAEVIERIFDPFFTTKQGGRGSGLGLSMVYSIVKAHGGLIGVQSSIGVGTQFKVYLPTVEAGSSLASQISVSRDRAPVAAHDTVLVAEDDELVRSMLTSALEARGYHVVAAHNGEEAVALYGKYADSVGAVVLDDNMPKLLGREAAVKILEVNPRAKVLVTSGYGKIIGEAENRPENVHFLSKPYTLDQLFDAIGRISH